MVLLVAIMIYQREFVTRYIKVCIYIMVGYLFVLYRNIKRHSVLKPHPLLTSVLVLSILKINKALVAYHHTQYVAVINYHLNK